MRIALVSRAQFTEMVSKTHHANRWVLQIPMTNFYSVMLDVLFLVKDDHTVIKFQDEQEMTMQLVMQAFAEARVK